MSSDSGGVPDSTHSARRVVVRCLFCGTANRVSLQRLAAGPRCGQCKRPIRLDRPQQVTEADFDQSVNGSEVPVLVDFYADWCGPCRMMAPILDELALARAGEVLVLKLDTDANPALLKRFGVRGIPTLISFRAGRETGRHVGLADRAALEALLARE